MKKLLLSILCLTLLVSATFFASGCKNSANKNSHSATDTTNTADTTDTTDTSHTHTFSVKNIAEKYLASEATCIEKAKYYYSCSCGEKGLETFGYGEPLNHSFTNYVSDGNATYEKDGTKTAHCDHKGCTITKTIPDEGSKLESKMSFKTLSVNGDKVYGKVSNNTETFSFINEIEYSGLIKYFASFDIYGKEKIETKTISLKVGDNKVYITELLNDEPKAIYEVTIRRRPVYTIDFKTEDGTILNSQTVEEDSIISEPALTRAGYTFENCDYDFSEPITQNTVITTNWTANTDTAYKVEYYLENLEDNDYTLYETNNLQGTTDSFVSAEVKTYDGFYYSWYYDNSNKRISGDGSTVLKVFYARNTYTLSNKTPFYGNITNATTKKYGSEQINSIATEYLGCEFIGWFNGEKLLSTEKEYSFMVEYNVTAEFKVKKEMLNLSFISSVDTCHVTGVNDKTVSEIIIPDYITSIGENAFQNCSKLTSITIPDSVTSIGERAFYGCRGLTNATIPDSVTAIGSFAFEDCNNLKYNNYDDDCYLGNQNNPYVVLVKAIDKYRTTYSINAGTKVIGSTAFCGCSNLTNITIPDSVTMIGSSAFENCSSLTNITIPDSVTMIDSSAFENCSSLTSIAISDSVTIIGYSAFENCNSLTSITIPDSVTMIDTSTFAGCKTLTEVTIGEGVKNIRSYAFKNCISLERISYHGTKAQWDAIRKRSDWLTNCSALLVCSDGQYTLQS